MLHEGDEILEVNGIEMKGRNVNQVCDLLAEMTGMLTATIIKLLVNPILLIIAFKCQSNRLLIIHLGTLTFVIAQRDSLMMTNTAMARIHNPHILPPQSQVFHLRALYDYDPDEDLYIPCRELGICFNKGRHFDQTNDNGTRGKHSNTPFYFVRQAIYFMSSINRTLIGGKLTEKETMINHWPASYRPYNFNCSMFSFTSF